ncbi:CvpA family protein [Treponema pallidum]|uniref:Uncharacterized protein TP_0522 n=6 Tax=Treponema pallidum TaxID=160 RepID=Y522_TREPA|nr:CvpA family protein [Treponema pallidum]O83534.1 RecName: Full=Uncharacterized protein TP_0522 [Treponema pallidum subsp. pallidum str. Nichols]AAC65511.1 predicted coding region TP0522 [Treponema pallidum subsp. pallidum str. Nichols]ACD70944.1 hypothetical protein TPASS_0522 [Treponema pallidum subsp. pallidum SS14]ADD72633.1 CvpA family protein [Treponema pallidum subsp. pallidum str. Chicago]AEZ57643.1 hypothetical protein TPESAMD_0522 [Treponema pallidum subsp. pertenue str. SamoaD]AE
MTISTLDLILGIIMGIVTVRATMRGFVDEFFSKASILCAAVVAILCHKRLVPLTRVLLGHSILLPCITFLITFMGVYCVMLFLRSRMRTYATRDLISGFNQVFGFFFGIIEGSVLLTVILLLLHVQPFVSVSHMLHESVINTVLSPLVLDGVRYMRLKM